MNKKVTVEHPQYGMTELNVERVIAMVPDRRWVLFEYTYWQLSEEDYNKVYEVWKQL